MDGVFYTLQEFMTHTKGVTYILIIAILLSMWGFWNFLNERDDD
ncbi:sulfate respiration complex protein HmcD [Thermodesulfobacteriota bacterium]